MTTKDSPPEKIHAQAVKIAKRLKLMVPDHKPHVKIGIIMDDKVLTIKMTWEKLASLTEAELVVAICAYMREEKPNPIGMGLH